MWPSSAAAARPRRTTKPPTEHDSALDDHAVHEGKTTTTPSTTARPDDHDDHHGREEYDHHHDDPHHNEQRHSVADHVLSSTSGKSTTSPMNFVASRFPAALNNPGINPFPFSSGAWAAVSVALGPADGYWGWQRPAFGMYATPWGGWGWNPMYAPPAPWMGGWGMMPGGDFGGQFGGFGGQFGGRAA